MNMRLNLELNESLHKSFNQSNKHKSPLYVTVKHNEKTEGPSSTELCIGLWLSAGTSFASV